MNQEEITAGRQPTLPDSAEGGEEQLIHDEKEQSQSSDPNPVSPLEPLDPHRLRDMVVDKQQTASAGKTLELSVPHNEREQKPNEQMKADDSLESRPGNISSHPSSEHELFRSPAPATPRQVPTPSVPTTGQSGHASASSGQSDRRGGVPSLIGSPLPPESPGPTPTGARSSPHMSNLATSQQHPPPQPQFTNCQPSPSNPSHTPGYNSNNMDVVGVQPSTVSRTMAPVAVPAPPYMGPYPGQPHWGTVPHPGSACTPYGNNQQPPPRFISHVQMGRVPYPIQGYPMQSMYLHPSQMGYVQALPQTLTSPAVAKTQPQKSQHGPGASTAKGQKGKRQSKKAAEQIAPQPQHGTPNIPPPSAAIYQQSPTYQQHPIAVAHWGQGAGYHHPLQQAGYGYQQAPSQHYHQAMAQGGPYPMHVPLQQYQYGGGAFPPHQMLGATMAPRYPPPRHPSQQQQSPHYLTSPNAPLDQSPGTSDMRSPPIVSPSQVGQVPPPHPPHQAIPHFQHHHHQPPQPPQPLAVMRATPAYMGHYPATPVFYFGHDPAQAARCSPEICLAGCVFLVLEEGYPPQLQFQVDRSTLPLVIRFYGGDVEQPTPRGIPERVTHVLCSSIYPQSNNKVLLQQALSDSRKRLVTYHWLNETLMRRRMEPPIKACHLPTCCGEGNRPAVGKLMAVSGFDELETINVKFMITAIGGVYAKSINEQSHILIVKQGADPALIERARQLGHQVVNYQWLMEIYLGNMRAWADWENPTFSANNINSTHAYVSTPTYMLERVSEFCQKLLAPWKVPIALGDDVLRLAIHMKTLVVNDKTVLFPHRQFKLMGDAPTEEQIDEAHKKSVSERGPEHAPNGAGEPSAEKEVVRVHFDGLLPAQTRELGAKIKFLGGEVADSVGACSHLVVPNLERSLKLLEALAAGKDVVSPQWIQQSYSLVKLIDCLDFSTHDIENERKYCFNLRNTLLRARRRRVFQDVTFHLSDNVKPSFEALRHLISMAGGSVQKERPLKKQLARCIETDTTYLIVVNRDDLHSYKYLTACNLPLFNEEFILMSILRSKIEPAAHYRVLPPPPLMVTNGQTGTGSVMAQHRTCSSTQPAVVRERNASQRTMITQKGQ